MSLRLRIALVLGAVAALATAAVGVLGYRTTEDRLYGEIDRSLTEATALVVADAGRLTGGRLTRGVLSVYDVVVFTRDGRIAATTFDAPPDPSAAAAEALADPQRVVYENVEVDGVEHRARTQGLPTGSVQVLRSLEGTDNVLRSLRARTTVLVLLVTAGAVLAGSAIAGPITARLRRLTAAAGEVSSTGRYDVELPAPGSDEVGTLSRAFRRMLDTIDRSRAAQQRLVQDAGHELKTPLTSMRTNLDVLRRFPELSADQRAEIVGDLHAEIEQLVVLVDEIVAVASGEHDDEPPTGFDLAELAAEVADRHERRTGRVVQVRAAASPVVARRQGIQRALSNLLDNAGKFDTSSEPITIEVEAGRVEVLDRGPGIPDDSLDLVFERFHRVEAARSMPGSGLGLSIVRGVVERDGGTVHARNRPGGGAAVGFSLPLAGEGSSPAPTGAPLPPPATGGGSAAVG